MQSPARAETLLKKAKGSWRQGPRRESETNVNIALAIVEQTIINWTFVILFDI